MVGLRTIRDWVLAASVSLASGLVTAAPLLAASGFTVPIDQVAILSTVAKPRAIILGNPSIADATLQGDRLVITGKSYGTTNLILLDENGATISEIPLTVVGDSTDRVSVFKGGKRYSYSCTDNCNPVLDIGDDNQFFDDTARQIGTKGGLATGGR